MGIRNTGLLLGAGFLLGSVGVKAATSKPAKDLYVKAISKGLQAKAAGEELVEQAKSELDDLVAEASYLNTQEAEAEDAPAASAPKKARSARKAAKK
ncbi:MAG: DUF6110 family protein [Coriobacteriales bacterium]|jgi:hypothetical protein|nr:DUF6110 family protein [Coriobacteriales bacterium]